jgi:hypothetical protein
MCSPTAEPDEGRLHAGAFTMEELKKLLQSTVDKAVAIATGAGPSKLPGTAGARFGTDPEHEHRQQQYQQDMHRFDAAGYINEHDEIYGSRYGGMEGTTGRQQGLTASVGNSKVTSSLPPAFDPAKDKWLCGNHRSKITL